MTVLIAADPTPAPGRSDYLKLAAALLIFCIVPGLFMGLHADDWFQIRPRDFSTVLATFAGDWNSGAQRVGGFYRPLVRVLFSVDSLLFRDHAWGYHLTNGLILSVIAVAVFRIARLLSGGSTAAAVFFTITILLLNPLKNEALFWVSGRTDLLAAGFMLCALWAALEGLERHCVARASLAVALLAGGLLSKESAISGCAILPLAAMFLKPAGASARGRRVALLLTAGPIALGVVYFFARAHFLGGLAGYSTGHEPRAIGSFVAPVLRMLSALFWPWQADGPASFRIAFAAPGLAIVLMAIAFGGFRRAAVFSFLAMIAAMLPAALIDISPNDGERVLLAPLCFQALLFASLFPRSTVVRAVVLFCTITLQRDNIAITRNFIQATGDNAAAIEDAWRVADALEDGAIIIAPEPPRTQERRILDPGIATDAAIETLWMFNRDGAALSPENDPEELRFCVALSSAAGSIRVAQFAQPLMTGRVVQLRPDGAPRILQPLDSVHVIDVENSWPLWLDVPPGDRTFVAGIRWTGPRVNIRAFVEDGELLLYDWQVEPFVVNGENIAFIHFAAPEDRPIKIAIEPAGKKDSMRMQTIRWNVFSMIETGTNMGGPR